MNVRTQSQIAAINHTGWQLEGGRLRAFVLVAGTALVVAALYQVFLSHPDRSSALPPLVPGTTPIQRVIVIMKENHAFDNYFGTYPRANGIPENASLPDGSGGRVSPHWLSMSWTPDLPHSRADMITSFDVGENDLFAVVADHAVPGLGNISVGYYDRRQLPYYWSLAQNFTLADRYFASILGPTTPNRLFSIAGQAGGLTTNPIHGLEVDFPTIFDQLDARGISWRYYGIANELETTTLLQLRHVVSNPAMSSKVIPLSMLARDIRSDDLPSVTYIDPNGFLAADLQINEHPPGNVTTGQTWTESVVQSIMTSSMWASCVIILTWDESGGFYDHVPPPQVDQWGYGFRVPMLAISPFSRRGSIDHDVMDHTSILKFIARNWNLPARTPREALASDMMSIFDFPVVIGGNLMGSSLRGERTNAPRLQAERAYPSDILRREGIGPSVGPCGDIHPEARFTLSRGDRREARVDGCVRRAVDSG